MAEQDVRSVLVRTLRWEAVDVLSIELEAGAGEELPRWSPGAHVDLILPDGQERQYSLCGDPAGHSWRLAVLREQGGKGGSRWIHEHLRPGMTLQARGPRNHFELVDAPAHLFIAGGIGITPILPMVRQIAQGGGDWRLLYGGRQRASMAFLAELKELGASVTLQPQDEMGLLDLDEALAAVPGDGVVYCCGPTALLDAVSERCESAGLRIVIERFEPLMSAEEARAGGAFEVELARSGLTVEVGDGQSILEAVEAAGVVVSASCLEGTCGTCETPVLNGAVDHRDGVLTEGEREANETMMICVSRAVSSRLVLDL